MSIKKLFDLFVFLSKISITGSEGNSVNIEFPNTFATSSYLFEKIIIKPIPNSEPMETEGLCGSYIARDYSAILKNSNAEECALWE